MKVEVQFLGNSLDVDTHEAEYVGWGFMDGQLNIFAGTKDEADRVASYPESRVVRVRVVAD
jgi:hypothetical protein